MIEIPVSPLELDPLTRMYWGQWDANSIGQLAPLALDKCYKPKFYKAPASGDELIVAYGVAEYGLRITPGSIIFGFYLPALVSTSAAPAFNVQITDSNLKIGDKAYTFFDQPIPSFFLGNYKPTYLTDDALQTTGLAASFPSLLPAPHPVTGDGLFFIEFWDTTGGTSGPQGSAQRLELVIGVLEVVDKCQ